MGFKHPSCLLTLTLKRPTRPTTNEQKKEREMPTLRKIKRGVLPTHLLTQKHHI
jgi:hypothetical protein